MGTDPVDYDSRQEPNWQEPDTHEDEIAYEAARWEHLAEGSPAPPRICPTFWPNNADILAALNAPSASYACRDALTILKGIGGEALHKAALQMDETFDWIGNNNEIQSDGPNGLGYYPGRCVLQGALQYMAYCTNELPVSNVIDEELGPDADDATLYALLSISLFVQAAQINVLESVEAPLPCLPEYSEIIGTACYAACEAKNRRAMTELRARLSIQAEADQAARRKLASQEANAARHKMHRDAKALVLKWWNDGDYAKFSAKSVVAAKYPDALEAAGLRIRNKPFKPSTVETWLAEGRPAEGKPQK